MTAIKQFDQAVVELGGNKTIAILSGVFRDIYAGELYVRLTARPVRHAGYWRADGVAGRLYRIGP